MKTFARARARLYGALALTLFCGGGFAATTLINVSRFGNRTLPAIQSLRLDAHIPFLSGWVWIYILYYPFCFLPLLLREVRNDPKTFLQTVTAFALQFGISFGIFLLWPMRMIHPGLPKGINGIILHKLYSADLGFSSFPSLHLANVVFVSLLFFRLRGKQWGVPVLMVAALIAMSTLFVKQHFITDVLLGALVGWGSYHIAFAFNPEETSF